jgi:hypothetical protein
MPILRILCYNGSLVTWMVVSYVTTDGQSASLSWNNAPIWGLRPGFCYCQTAAGLLMWAAFSDGRTGLSFARVTVSSNMSVVSTYNLLVIKCIYIQHIQGLCQSRLSTAVQDLSLVAPATTAVYSLERSYAWLLPSLSLLQAWPPLVSSLYKFFART